MKKFTFLIFSLFIVVILLQSPNASLAQGSITNLLEDNFENGINGWITEGSEASGSSSLWHQSTRKSDSPANAWYYGKEETGDYDTGSRNNGYLISPTITIPANIENPSLSFQTFLETENTATSSAGSSYDKASVEITSDNGSTWNHLATVNPTNNQWVGFHTSLPQYYTGPQIKLRFKFDTLDSSSNNFEGWYVDDFLVSGTEMTPTPTITPTPVPTNRPAIANPGGPYSGTEDQPIRFDSSLSADPDGDFIQGYEWSFGDVANAITWTQGTWLNKTYTKGGTYTVTLRAYDGKVYSDPVSTTVTVAEVNDAPVANAGADKNGFVNAQFGFNGSLSTDEEGALSYSWNFGDNTQATGVNPSHAYTQPGTYSVVLTITDAGGKTAQDTALVTVNKDQVAITKALYNQSLKQLTVEAMSNGNAQPVLTVTNVGQMTYNSTLQKYVLVKNNLNQPPSSVTVQSSYGGVATATVQKIKK